MKSTDSPIIVEQTINASKGKIWEAITNVELMRQWFFDNIKSFKPEVGFKTKFKVHSEDRIFTHLWEVTEVDPQQKIVYNWTYDEYPGDSIVNFELIENKNSVRLILTTEVLEDFPEDIPEFTRESCIGGWNYFIKERLKEFLEGNNIN